MEALVGDLVADIRGVCGGDHGCRASVDGVDDLGVVDPAEVCRGDPEVGASELTLDDEQRDPFACHLDGVCVA
jgi:hypothetical protein